MIELGLARIRELLLRLGNPQHAIHAFHVAGTNGKGSVCTYLESVLSAERKLTGKFTSPHFISPNDAIQIGQRPLEGPEYGDLLASVSKKANDNGIAATEFELQTAVAFEAFRSHKIDIGIVEVGLGGREDATNVLEPSNVLCSAVTKVALDHESFLGSRLRDIAAHKAGIIKEGRPCVVDGSNEDEVLDVVQEIAHRLHAPLTITEKQAASETFRHQNAKVAIAALKEVFPGLSDATIEHGIGKAVWPGRMQWTSSNVLVDGAHNLAAALELRKYVDKLNKPVWWILAFSKPADSIMAVLVRPGDKVTTTEFGSVDQMPWIRPQSYTDLAAIARTLTAPENVDSMRRVSAPTVSERANSNTNQDGQVAVICGSLYLVADYLKQL